MQFSVRDQGDLAKAELRLSIITLLRELMNILNYTAGNTFCIPRGKVGICSLIWETLTFRTARFLVFSGFIWDVLKVKFGFLCQIFQWICQPNACALVLQVPRKLHRREKCLSIQKDVFHFWKMEEVFLHCALPWSL